MRSSLEHYCGFTRSTDDLLTFEVRGPVLAMIVVAIWLGVVGGVGFGLRQGTGSAISDLSWIAPGAQAYVDDDEPVLALSTGGDGRLRYLPFETMAPESDGTERIALR